ncbi:protein POOR HOMOLOGOUS SYNAPSIS 1-like [Bidens hawaiensis]|uniref:protein POOR HOMOLOGOUS SYNAPSIS 1-like n=1 Tax=Bidens hawaiensis TaxID=980011 RepID=UPI00404A5B9D
MSITTITTTVSIGDPFEVQYARFFNCPFRSTQHPALLPLSKKPKNSWISSSSLASLRLLATADHSVILTVTLLGHVIEEHYISKLNFTWPQVSCLTGYSPRGSKVVFMSYKDEVGQIQKFVVRFLAIDETERFINFLKEAFGQNGSTSGIYKSKTSSESEFVPSFEAENRPIQDWDLITTSSEFSEPIYRPIQDSSSMADCADTYIQPYYPIQNDDGSHLSQDVQGKLSAFPPSFTSLLMNCFPVANLGVFQATDPEDVILKRDIMKYLEDSSFRETLSKVQKVVNELGDDLLL